MNESLPTGNGAAATPGVTQRQITIDRLHIRLRGVTSSQARAAVEGLGEQILRRLAEESQGTPETERATEPGRPIYQTPASPSAGSRTVRMSEIQVSAPPDGIAQAVAQAVAGRMKPER